MDAKSLILFMSAITLEVMATVLFKKGTSRLANSIRQGWLSHIDNIINALRTKEIALEYDGVQFYFSSQENLNTFKANPTKYVPQYGGFCAYAMGAKGSKVPVNPETFEIRDGKLYLFYNKGNTNTLTLWTKEGAKELKDKADKNWTKITNK